MKLEIAYYYKQNNATIHHGKIKNGKDFYKVEYENEKGNLISIDINEKTFKELLPFLELELEDDWEEDKLFIYIFKS
ncbi:MAG: hypothetical protein ACOCRX_04750 [Candidatus Woesearchaeota archaeon]